MMNDVTYCIDNILKIAGSEVLKFDTSIKDENLNNLNYERYLKLSEKLKTKVEETVNRLINYPLDADFSENLQTLKKLKQDPNIRNAKKILEIASLEKKEEASKKSKNSKSKKNKNSRKRSKSKRKSILKKGVHLIKRSFSITNKMFSGMGKVFNKIETGLAITKRVGYILLGAVIGFAPKLLPTNLVGMPISYPSLFYWACGIVGTFTSFYNMNKVSTQIKKIKQKGKKNSEGKKKSKVRSLINELKKQFKKGYLKGKNRSKAELGVEIPEFSEEEIEEVVNGYDYEMPPLEDSEVNSSTIDDINALNLSTEEDTRENQASQVDADELVEKTCEESTSVDTSQPVVDETISNQKPEPLEVASISDSVATALQEESDNKNIDQTPIETNFIKDKPVKEDSIDSVQEASVETSNTVTNMAQIEAHSKENEQPMNFSRSRMKRISELEDSISKYEKILGQTDKYMKDVRAVNFGMSEEDLRKKSDYKEAVNEREHALSELKKIREKLKTIRELSFEERKIKTPNGEKTYYILNSTQGVRETVEHDENLCRRR